MTKIKRGAQASIVLLAACTWQIPAQITGQPFAPPLIVPEAINLDIAPATSEDPEAPTRRELAVKALEQPEEFHAWLLSLQPERGPAEERERLAILFPEQFLRAHPKTAEQARAEAEAAHAILNPHFDHPSVSHQD